MTQVQYRELNEKMDRILKSLRSIESKQSDNEKRLRRLEDLCARR